MMTGTKKPPEGGVLRDIEVWADDSISNTFQQNHSTTNDNDCNHKSAFTGSAAVGYSKQQLLFACIELHGGAASQQQIITAFKHAGFRPQQARDTVDDGVLMREVAVRTGGMELLVSRVSDPDSVDLRKRLVEVRR